MDRFQKRLLAIAAAAALAIAAGGAAAQTAEQPPEPPTEPFGAQSGGRDASEPVGPSLGRAADQAARLDALFTELAAPDQTEWARIEGEIQRLWAQSGSPAMDLLLRRASEAMEAEDYLAAVEHLSALTDHAPDFAEGWNARATAFYLMDEYALSLADIERTLSLNPRHFGALEGLASIMVELDQPELALEALRAAEAINPKRPSVQEGIARLERMTGAVEL